MTGREIYRGSMRGGLMQIKQLGFEPQTVIDIGAALGTFDLYEIFPESRHFLIEPIVENEPYLAQICRKLGNAEYIIAAATREPGTVNLTVAPALVHSSVSDIDTVCSNNSDTRSITAITLDQICRERKLEAPYLVKVDVDGKEVDVLAGATQTLKHTEYVIVEVCLYTQLNEVISFMRSQGFTAYDIVDLSWRPSDNALWQCDMAFVKESGRFRKNNFYLKNEQAKALDAHLKVYRERLIVYIEKNYSDKIQTTLSKSVELGDINLIIFPDWNQTEDLLYQDLASAIKIVATHPDKRNMMLLVDTSNTSEEEANLALSAAAMNLLLQEDLEVTDGPEISLVGELGKLEWEALLPCIQSRIILRNEDRGAIAAAGAENLLSYEHADHSSTA